MNAGKNRSRLILLIVFTPFMLACLYLERLIQVPEPTMETNPDTLLEVLKGQDWVPLESLASETYTDADYAKPGTLTYTVNVPNDKPVYFSYGWCAEGEDVLRQNFEHIAVQLYFNEGKLGEDVVHPISYTLPNGQICLQFGALLSDWPAGDYHLKAVAIFDAKINDGLADYDPGDYVFEYDVTVAK